MNTVEIAKALIDRCAQDDDRKGGLEGLWDGYTVTLRCTCDKLASQEVRIYEDAKAPATGQIKICGELYYRWRGRAEGRDLISWSVPRNDAVAQSFKMLEALEARVLAGERVAP